MLKHAAGYVIEISLLVALVVGAVGWLFVSRLRELDSLPALEKTMGLYGEWRERVAKLEERFPWGEQQARSWGASELETYLTVKTTVWGSFQELHSRYPGLLDEPASGELGSTEGLMTGLVNLRFRLMLAMERHGMSLSQYRYFEDLVQNLRERDADAGPGLSAEQRNLLREHRHTLFELDTGGFELLGLPQHDHPGYAEPTAR